MPTDDLPSAARRVAEHARTAPAYGDGGSVLDEDLRALLPVLVAMAAGQDDEARVKRWARVIDVSLWDMLDNERVDLLTVPQALRNSSLNRARAAIALADAERAAEAAKRWRAYEEARHKLISTALEAGQGFCVNTDGDTDLACTTLDAAVRHLAGLDPTVAPPR